MLVDVRDLNDGPFGQSQDTALQVEELPSPGQGSNPPSVRAPGHSLARCALSGRQLPIPKQ